MRKITLLFTVMLLILPVLPPVRAQDVIPITYGESFSGEIVDPENESYYFSFDGAAGDYVIIEGVSQTGDPHVFLLDVDGNVLAENDDTSPDNLNSLLEYTLEADGQYYIVVVAYAAGDFTLTLNSEGGVEGFSQTFTGSVDDSSIYAEFPVTLTEGQYISASASATTGDLDTYLYLTDTDYNIYAENDDVDKTTTDSYLEYEVEVSGDYLLIVTRYGQDTGESAGEFELTVSAEGAAGNNAGVVSSPAADYPVVNAPAAAEWTILAYLAGDNDLESSALIDLNEFEIAGGSDEQVRVVVFLDRSPDHDTSNGDWASVRVYEMSADSGGYDSDGYSPLIDTVELADLGSLNSGTGSTLADFLLWGVQNYPAQNYIVSVNDHGGGWTGLAGDDTTGTYISPFEFAEAFKVATEAAGMERFALLINDACLMSSIEYLDVVAPYFDYALGASEVMYGPGYDMTLLTQGLREGVPIDQLAIRLIDTYMAYFEGVEEVHPTQTPTLIDLHQFPAVSEAVENFAALVNSNPIAYARLLGEARYNTYEYGLDSWLSFLIDVGDLMIQLQRISDDPDLNAAAQGVLDAMSNAMVYSQRGESVPETASLYNLNFPESADEFISDYVDKTTLVNWIDMLSNYYNSFRTAARVAPAPIPTTPEPESEEEQVKPESLPPQVSITNIYPTDVVSINAQAIVSMEVVGRNIARGTFTVDQVQPDGSLRRVDTADIVTFVELEDGTFDYINQWDSGVNDFDFTWTPELTTLTDGTNTHIELIVARDNKTLITGQYRANPEADWIEVTLSFNDEGYATRGITTGEGGTSLAGSVQLRAGGEFQSYNAIVTPDGTVVYQPGNLYTIPEQGLHFELVNAPSGQYKLGFLMEALGGTTGFASTTVTVDNDNINPDLKGYTTLTEGFSILHPAEWSDMEFYSERDYYYTSSDTQGFYVYPIADAADLQSTVQGMVDRYELTLTSEPTPITVDGYEALEFSSTSELDGTVYTAKAFAVFKPDTETGLVFSAETTNGSDPSAAYQILLDNVTLFDAQEINAADTGKWGWDLYTEETYYPVPLNWLPGAESEFGWRYEVTDTPGAFVEVGVYEASSDDAGAFLQEVLTAYIEGYTLEKTETYYGEYHTWQVGYYTAEGVTGRVYVTIENGIAYIMWFEAPSDSAESLFRSTFEPMLDGFKITLE